MIARALVGVSVILGLARGAEAEDEAEAEGASERALAVVRSAAVTVRAGAMVPLVRLYGGGPSAGASFGWDLNAHTELVASADVGALFADGARRYLASLGAGVRVAPWRQGPWIQLGLGTTIHVERIGVALPDRMVRSTDSGVVVTGDLGLGVRVQRWELAVGYDHILRTSPYYERYDGDEELPFWGTAMAWVGMQL